MIAFTACDSKYFDLYFKLWAHTFNKFYPDMKKFVAIANAREDQINYAKSKNVEVIIAEIPAKSENISDRDYIGVYHLLRWCYLPWQHQQHILQTQINCVPIKTQKFQDLTDIQHLRISRFKRGKLGGISAAVFRHDAAKKLSEEAFRRMKNPQFGDHPINQWQAENIPSQDLLAELRINNKNFVLDPNIHWITATTSESASHEQKIYLLSLALFRVGITVREII